MRPVMGPYGLGKIKRKNLRNPSIGPPWKILERLVLGKPGLSMEGNQYPLVGKKRIRFL